MTSFATSKAGQLALVAAAGAVVGVAVASSSAIAVALVALAVALVAAAGALVYPERAFVVLVLLLALIPIYAAPEVGSLLFVPAAGAAWILAGVLAWRSLALDARPFRATAVDIAVGAFFLLMATSVAFSPQASVSDYLNVVFLWGGAYLAARLLLRETRKPVFLVAASFALVTVLVAPVAILEVAGRSNPFLSLQFNPVESAVWAGQASRFGQVRAEASFGHPIALSMFAATSAFLSLAMAINTERLRNRFVWFALAILAVGIQALALSRTGWLILALGIVVLTLATARGAARRRLAAVLAILAVTTTTMLAIAPPSQLQLLSDSGTGATAGSLEVANSGARRQVLLDRALQPGVLQAWGNPVNDITPAIGTSNSIDNAYILLANQWGLIPAAALVLVLLTLLPVIVHARSRRSGPMVALPIAALTSFTALFFVAFITQQQLMIWLLVGASGAIAERVSAKRAEVPAAAFPTTTTVAATSAAAVRAMERPHDPARILTGRKELPGPRVLLACDWFVKYTAGLAGGLADLGCEVVLLTRDHDKEFGDEPGAMQSFVKETLEGKAIHLEMGGRVRDPSRLGDLARLRGYCRRWEPEVVHVQEHLGNDMRLAAIAGLAQRRYALTVHDPVPHPGAREASAPIRVLERALRRRAHLVFVHSQALADELVVAGDVPGPIEVVPHGIGEVKMTKLPERPALLFFGRILHYKGLDTLLDAMPLVWAQRPDVTLTVAGAGYVPTHESLADSRVTLRAEHVPDAAVSTLFGEATCVVLPYRQASQSGVGSEAKRHGRAIVATAVGGLPELVTPDCGRLVPPEDAQALAGAIMEVVDTPGLAAEMSRRAAASVEDADWRRVAAKTIEAYQRHLL